MIQQVCRDIIAPQTPQTLQTTQTTQAPRTTQTTQAPRTTQTPRPYATHCALIIRHAPRCSVACDCE